MSTAAVVADPGFAAFAEHNLPRYARYAKARFYADTRAAGAVRPTLTFVHARWAWLLSQPSVAAPVWEELRAQIVIQTNGALPPITAVATLYHRLPARSADSALLCGCLGLEGPEAAELMGIEPSGRNGTGGGVTRLACARRRVGPLNRG
ncbi:hypothetical protein [Streptomyces sp. NPDC046860]|uniref:hypothetical protein n=1 Tax=Streptomyces sp. NPDC046860 TaxID=3154495 RepID=UPI0033C41C5C